MDKENCRSLANDILVFSPFKSGGNSKKSIKNSNVIIEENVVNSSNTLLCAKFQESLHLEFGHVPVNGSKTVPFYLKNPNAHKSVKVSVDKYDEKVGFTIALSEVNKFVEIPPLETVKGTINWKPIQDSAMREIIIMKLEDKAPLQVIVYGTSGTGQNESKSFTIEDKINRVKNFSKETLERRNTLIPYLSAPSKPNPNDVIEVVNNSNKVNKSAKNKKRLSVCDNKSKPKCQNTFLYDNKWAEKQSNSFKDWINFTFSKSQEVILTDHDDFKELNNDLDTSFNSIKANQMDEQSQSYANNFKILTQRRIDAKIRKAAMNIYNQDSFNSITSLIEDEVIENKLLMRDDRDIHADVGMQESLLSILFSYEYPWLRIGLEIVFGKIISLQKNKNKNSTVDGMPCMTGCNKWKNTLKSFIFDNLFTNTDITDQFCKQKLLYVAQEKKMKEMLRKHMLQKVLILVLFLDRARSSYLLPKSTLFCRESLYKSSKDIVAAFCRNFLRGEGDIIRHLSLLGYTLNFSQTYVHEFDFNVKNLALDLRDGVRIARLFELLIRSTTITTQLRVPAVSRLQKLHNVSLVLDKLYGESEKKPEAKAIVDGHRDITLMFLWKLLYTFELKMIITPAKVIKEVEEIQINDNWRRSIYSADEVKNLAVKVPVFENGKINKVISSSIDKSVSSSSDSIDDESLSFALQQWCQAIAGRYDVPVFDLTTCLADGRALCLLIHYYHPSILPTRLIKKTTANLMESYMGSDRLDSFMETTPTFTTSELNQAICNERKNFSLLKKACNCIGGIPLMLPEFDSKNVPEEKSMVVFLGYLFSRLIESSGEVTAAIRIQRAIRKQLPRMKSHYESRTKQNKKIQLATELPVITVENISILKMPVTISVSQHFAADIIKRNIRKFLDRKQIQSLLVSDVDIQILDPSTELIENSNNNFDNVTKLDDSYEEDATNLSDAMFNSHSYENWMEQVESGDDIRSNLEIKLSIEEIARIKAESEIQEALAKNKELEEKLQHEELFTLSITEKLAEEAQARVKAEEEAKLELEKRLLMTLELEIAKESLIDARLHEELKSKETQELIESSKLESSQFHSQIEVLAQCEKEARSIAEEKVRLETELRMNAEERIKELEYERELEKERIAVAEREKIEIAAALESKWEEEHRQRQEELRIIAEDAEKLKAEQAARFQSEENARKEREARELLELKMQEEREARIHAEMRLKAFEDAKLAEQIHLERIMEETRQSAIKSFCSATIIQSKWRSFSAVKMKRVVVTGVILMQSVCRGYADRKKSLRLIISIRILQSLWRRKQCNKILETMNKASKSIQFFWKGYADRKFYNNLKESTVLIQAKWKSVYYSNKFKIYKLMATKIQSQFRRILNAKYVKGLVTRVVQIQSFIRFIIAKNLRSLKLKSIKTIQRYLKKSLTLQKCKAEYYAMKKIENLQNARYISATTVVTRFLKKVSKYLNQKKAVFKISKWFISRLPLLRVRKLNNGFHRLQAVFRSRKVKSTSSKKISDILKRIKSAEEKAKLDPTLMIGRQTSHALSVLQNGKMISHILKACQTLELSTQLSKRCSEAFAHAQAANILFALLRSCNRSTPHQELLRIALVVLLNVARYDSLATFVSMAEDAADALVDLMQMFRDKKSIFILAAELLTRLVNASQTVKEICNSPIYRKRLEGILHIIERKNRLEVRVRSISVNMPGAPTTVKPTDEFMQYKGKNYESIEPIVCIQHLMRLLNE